MAGFTIDRNRARIDTFIRSNDICDEPEALAPNEGIVYQRVGGRTCTCTTKSTIVLGGIAEGETESYATSALNWRTDSTNYCPNSPYQRPKN